MIGLILLLFILAILGWLLYAKIRSGAEIIAMICLFLSIGCFSLWVACRYYFDNSAVDLAISYLRQALPFVVLLGVLCLQSLIAILFDLSDEERSIRRGLARILRQGRIIWQAGLIFLACMALMLAFIPIRDNYYPSFDSSIFSYIGQQILKGKLPYVDGWDHKPALIFYIDALGLWLANGHLIGIWLLEFIALLAGGLIFFNVLKKAFPESIALLVTVLGIFHQARLFDFGNYTEEFSLFFQMLALGIAFSAFFQKHLKLSAFLSGLLCGLAFTCKQNTIGFWGAIVLLELLIALNSADRKEAWREFLKKFIWLAAGFLLINAIWVTFFAAQGILREYWETGFVYNFVYAQKSGASRWATSWTTLTFLPSLSVFLMLAFLSWPGIVVSWLFKSGKSVRETFRVCCLQKSLLALAILWLPVELFLAGLSGMNYQHYFILCIPPACILAAWLGDFLLRSWGRKIKPQFSLGLVIALFAVGSAPMLRIYQQNYEPRMPSANTKTADFLLENTQPDDLIQLWGGSLAPYVMTQRSAGTRYFNVRPLYLFPDFMQEQQWDLFLTELKSDSPKWIIYMNDRFLAQVPYDTDGFCAVSDLPAYQQETYQYLCENYSYQETINEGMQDEWGVFGYKQKNAAL